MSRAYPDRPILGVGALILNRDQMVVVRRASEPLKTQWSLPGGMVECGETLVRAVKREALEETNLSVEPYRLAGIFERIFPDVSGRTQFHYVLVDYLCRVVSGELAAGSDVDDARWIDRQQLSSLAMDEETRNLITRTLSS